MINSLIHFFTAFLAFKHKHFNFVTLISFQSDSIVHLLELAIDVDLRFFVESTAEVI
jgi:hypothetical protein